MTDGIDRIQRALEAASQARNPQDAARSIISAMAGDLSSRDLSGLLEQASRNAGDGIELVAKFEMEENQP